MGVPKTKWTPEEEAALRLGVAKYGPGKWRLIQRDPEYGPALTQRSNVDLKDKWRNLHPDYADAKAKKAAAVGDERPAGHARVSGGAGPSGSAKPAKPRASRNKYEDWISAAVWTLREKNGSSIISIQKKIEEMQNVDANAQSLRRVLQQRIKQMEAAGKLLKVKQSYKLADGITPPSSTLGSGGSSGGAKGTKQTVPIAGTKREGGADVPLFLINGQKLTAEEAAREAERAVQEAERAAEEAERAAREAEIAEQEAAEAERLQRLDVGLAGDEPPRRRSSAALGPGSIVV